MLKSLVLDNCESLTSVVFNSNLLTSLSLAGCRGITCLELTCPYLEQLTLGGCDHLGKATFCRGKRNPSAADHTIDIVKNPHYLVLLSEDFIVACVDLSQSRITILPSNPIPVTVSSPPSTLTFVSSDTFQDDSRLQTTAPFSTSQEIISKNDKLQTSAPFSTSQEIISNNGKLQHLKPVVSVSTSALILNKLAQASLMNPTGLSSSVPTSQRVTPSEKLSATFPVEF